MHPSYIRKALGLIVGCLMVVTAFSQSKYEGDMLLNVIGKDTQSSEVSNLKSGYNFEMANEDHYLSNQGIELMMQNGVLNEINLYKQSTVYGNFKGKLPKGLSFGLTSAEVKRVLGTPSVSYNTGYCEFDLHGLVISCWFENDRLSQVDLGLK